MSRITKVRGSGVDLAKGTGNRIVPAYTERPRVVGLAELRDEQHPFWAHIETEGWERVEPKGEWEYRRYDKWKATAIFFMRRGGGITCAGNALTLWEAWTRLKQQRQLP